MSGKLVDDTGAESCDGMAESPIDCLDGVSTQLRCHGLLMPGLSTISDNEVPPGNEVCQVQLLSRGWLFVRIGKIELHINEGGYSAERLPKVERKTAPCSVGNL